MILMNLIIHFAVDLIDLFIKMHLIVILLCFARMNILEVPRRTHPTEEQKNAFLVHAERTLLHHSRTHRPTTEQLDTHIFGHKIPRQKHKTIAEYIFFKHTQILTSYTNPTMRCTQLLTLAALAAPALAAELSVKVYEGPTECEESDKVKSGDYLEMHYTGTIDESSETGEKGKKFDSSRDRGQTFDVQIGIGRVIKGWDDGIVGLCKGAKAVLVIPPEMGYGETGAGNDIPGGATLNFDVEVVDIKDGPPPGPNYFAMIDENDDGFLDKDEITAYFQQMGREVPDELWEAEDKDKDGKISWEEFSGPKGTEPPSAKEEL